MTRGTPGSRPRRAAPRRLAAASAAIAAALAGCGGEDRPAVGDTGRSSRLVDFSKDPPYVNALDLEPGSGDFLLTTNRGFWRIDRESGAVRRIQGTVRAGRRRSPVGTFLEIEVEGPRRLLGSGHPDRPGALPNFLGVIRSDDGGRSWRVVSRLGDADLHKIVLRHGRMYAFDAVLSAMLVSRDGGRSFEEQFTPRGLIIDFDVDPRDPEHIVAANEEQLFRSRDGGRSWRPLAAGRGIRLAWPAADALYRADAGGEVLRSQNGGGSWTRLARVDGEPYKLEAADADRLFLALSDGTILESTEGGSEWRTAFRP